MAIDGKSKDGVIEQSGTAAERIALDVERVIQGSEFYETDTTARYKMYSGEWVQIVASGGASSYVAGGGGGGGGGGQVTIADGGDVTQGAKANAAAPWYNSVASVVSLIKLWIAVAVGAGSHAYGYNGSGQLVTDAWTLLGITRTKTYTYVAGVLTTESDWV